MIKKLAIIAFTVFLCQSIAFSFNSTNDVSNFVNISGDTMTGNLTVTEITVSTINATSGEDFRFTKDDGQAFHFGMDMPASAAPLAGVFENLSIV